MIKPQRLSKRHLWFIVFAACCIIIFFAAAVICSSPTIELNGSEHVYLELKEPYSELGAIAKDPSGNVLPIVISGTVDSSVAGDTEIVYYATYLGKKVTVSRIVTVQDTRQ